MKKVSWGGKLWSKLGVNHVMVVYYCGEVVFEILVWFRKKFGVVSIKYN